LVKEKQACLLDKGMSLMVISQSLLFPMMTYFCLLGSRT
jgi:hypothetical protein